MDLRAESGLLYLTTKDLNNVAKSLEDISSTLGHFASGFSKPVVRTIDEKKYRAEEIAQYERLTEKSKRKLGRFIGATLISVAAVATISVVSRYRRRWPKL